MGLIFSKIKLIIKFLQRFVYLLLTKWKYWWGVHSESSINLRIFLNSIMTTLKDTFLFLQYKSIKKYDKEHLYLHIKKRAHHLDKILLFPERHINSIANNSIYNDLKSSIQKWKQTTDKETKPIKWALKILADYENNFPENCPECRIIREPKGRDVSIKTEDLLNLMQNRRSRRFFSNKPLNNEERELLVKAALYAPCSCNKQPLRLIFIEDPILKRITSKCISGGVVFFNDAPSIIIVLIDMRGYRYPNGRMTPYQDASAAIENILLLAETMGLACCWGSLTTHGEIINEKELRKLLLIPKYFLISGSIAIGHKSDEVSMIPRDNPKIRYSIDRFHKNTN